MKTVKFIGMAVCMALFAINFTACSDDDPVKEEIKVPEISVPVGETNYFQSGMALDTKACDMSLTFKTNVDWKISVAETRNGSSWCSVAPTSGKAGINTVKVTADENATFDDRNVVLTVTAGTAKKTVSVTQKQKDALTLTQNKFEVGPKGGDIKVEVKANISYQVAISEKAKSWITQSKSRGLSISSLVFKVAESDEAVKREGEIVIKSGDFSETVHVYQAGQKILLLSKNAVQVAAKGETVKVEIKSNFTYGVKMPKVDWIAEATGSRGTSSHTLYYEVKANETYDARSAQIVFFDKDSQLADTLKISQGQKDGFILNEKEVSVGAAGGEFKVGVSANIAYDVAVDADWITKVNSRGLTSESLTFSAKENTSDKPRTAKITFTDKSKVVLGTVLVSQGVKSKGGKKLVTMKITEYDDVNCTEVYYTDKYQFEYDKNGRLAKSVFTTDFNRVVETSTSHYSWEKDKIFDYLPGKKDKAEVFEVQNGLVRKSYYLNPEEGHSAHIRNYVYTGPNRVQSIKQSGMSSYYDWNGDKIMKLTIKEFGDDEEKPSWTDTTTFTYTDNLTCKGYSPLISYLDLVGSLTYTHPELFGKNSVACPTKAHEESISPWGSKDTTDYTFTYKFDKEGYMVRCEFKVVERSDSETLNYSVSMDCVWE